jgi:hypothetical protein
MGKSIKKAFSNPIRGLTAIGTFGTSELARRSNIPGLNQMARLPETASDSLLGTRFGRQGAADLPSAPGGQSPTDLLTSTGGAPLLANIAMGVDPVDALAGYFGKSKKDGSWEEFLGTLSQNDLDKVNAVNGQLTTIQSDRKLRQTAVDKVIADFPNIATFAAQERAKSGEEFDSVTKGYMDQALQGTAAKFAAGGNLSSGAMNEAVARVGAEQGMAKLGFMGEREGFAYNTKLNEMNTRLAEVNALRDFQNTMMGQGVQQGFSAQQANLQRQFAGQQQNAEMANQQRMSDQASSNAMFGAIGSLGGTILGGSMGGMLGGSLFGSTSPKTTTPGYKSIGSESGFNLSTPLNSNQYRPKGY